MAIRMSGLASGLDTEAIIEQLMDAQKMKKTKVENKKTKLEWKQEIWSSLNTKLNTFHTTWASKMRFQASYKSKKAVSSNEGKLAATAKNNATNGSYNIKINKLATSQYVTGGKITAKDEDGNTVNAKSSTKLSSLVGDSFKEGSEIAIVNGDKKTTLVVDETTTIADFVAAAKNAGLNASFDEAQQRLFVSAASSGEAGKFTITATQSSDAVVASRKELREKLNYSTLSSSDKTKVDSALDAYISGTAEEKKEALQTLQNMGRKAAIENETNAVKIDFEANFLMDYINADTEPPQYTANAEKDEELRKYSKKTEAQWNALSDEKKVDFAHKMAGAKAAEYVKKSDVKENIELKVDNPLDAAVRNGEVEALTDTYAAAEAADTSPAASDILGFVGLSDITGEEVSENLSSGSGMVVIAAQDSEVVVNGATMTSSSTTFEVNGLSLELRDTTAVGETVNVTVSNDNDSVYDMVKDFIKEYNSILKEMNTLYNADRAKDYEPLTDEQKEEMSEDEIEKWEKKIKDSLLRRDDSLEGVINIMKNSMMGSVKIDGKSYSLASLGIMTSTDYSEKGLLHIYGDTEDTVYADKDDKLKKMIDEDPDLVMNIMVGLTTNLYNSMSKKMQADSMSSSQTFYNDKQMKTQLDEYKSDIKDWEKKLKEMEDRYYNQFTAMEKALASLQSQQNSLSGLLG